MFFDFASFFAAGVAIRSLETKAAAGAEATLAAWGELLEALGFRRVWEVLKRRRRSEVSWQGSTIEVAIDTVAGLGDFLELEILASAAEIPLAVSSLQSLAAEIGLGQPERRSYLEMLLAARPPD